MRNGQCLTIGTWRAMWNASHFLDLYLGELKGNGVQSYRRVFPRAKYKSAKASASRMLKKPSVVQVMKHKSEKMEVTEKY
jgi:hypothetical protein